MEQASSDNARRRLSPDQVAALERFKAYATSHTLLQEVDRNLSLAIEEPAGFAYVLLYGPSGVGKTTLIRQMEQRSRELHSSLSALPRALSRWHNVKVWQWRRPLASKSYVTQPADANISGTCWE